MQFPCNTAAAPQDQPSKEDASGGALRCLAGPASGETSREQDGKGKSGPERPAYKLGRKAAALKSTAKQGIDTQGGSGNGSSTSSGGKVEPELPEKAYKANPDVVENYPHTKKVGHYLLGRELGAGSFATVREALHDVTGERVAVKIINKETAKADAYVSRNMRREGRILQLIRHPNVVQLLDIMETENCYYLVTEMCHGGDFMTHLVKRRRLTEAETRRFLRQMVQAVDYMHGLGILHRDLKIENLLLTQDQNVKIIDFGLSNMVRALPDENGNIVTQLCRTQCGSPAYAAPEVLAKKPYGTAVDVWSLGVNMFAMLTGNLPFTVKPYSIKALHSKMVNQELNPLPKTLSASCRDLLMRLLNPQPETRIKLKDVMNHPWLNENVSRLKPSPFPNHLNREDLRPDILQQVSQQLIVPETEVARKVLDNSPGPCLSTYVLLLTKTERYCRQNPLVRTRPQLRREENQSTKMASPVTGVSSVATVQIEAKTECEAAEADATQSLTVNTALAQKEPPQRPTGCLPRREKTFAGCVPLSVDSTECSELVPLSTDGARENRASGSQTARHGSLPRCITNLGAAEQQYHRYHRTLPGLPELVKPQTPKECWTEQGQQSERGSVVVPKTSPPPVPPLRRVGTECGGRTLIQSLVTQRYAGTLPPADGGQHQTTPQTSRSYQTASRRPAPLPSQLITANSKAVCAGAAITTVRRFSEANGGSPELGRR